MAIEADRLIAGRYDLGRLLGSGQMSAVHLAKDRRRRDELVAVKLLNSQHPDVLQREFFRRETLALERLRHRNIVRIHDHGRSEPDGCFYIVLEYVDRTLLDLIQEKTRAGDQAWVWPIMRAITTGLAEAHGAGVIHRDIKPGNILVDEAGVPKITDFGISRLKYELAAGQTVSGFWSPGYAAPERRHGQSDGERSDLFSLGAVFYQMLSGQSPPSDGPTPAMARELRVSRKVTSLLARLLAPNPDDRPATADEVAKALSDIGNEVLPAYLLVITISARDNLYQHGFIQSAAFDAAREWLLDELGGQELEPVAVLLNEANGDVTILGRSVRVICTRHHRAPALVVKTVQKPYGPNLEAERERAATVRADWQPISASELESLGVAEAQTYLGELDALYDDLTNQRHLTVVQRARRVEKRAFLDEWESALRYQQKQLEERSSQLAFSSAQARDGQLIFTLSSSPPENLSWEVDTPLAVVMEDGRRASVGSLVTISESSVIVSQHELRSTAGSRGMRRPPQSGALALDLVQEFTSLKRQRDALALVRAGATANPRLAEVLVDVQRAECDLPDGNIHFIQEDLAPDKQKAVRRALATRDIFLLQGPPGTGKTTAIAEIILQILAAKPDARILVTSQSNVAVNHALSRVSELHAGARLEIVRLGREEKIGQGAERWMLDQRVRSWRDEVTARCHRTLRELATQAGARRTDSRRRSELRGEIEQCLTWLDEAARRLDELYVEEERLDAMIEASRRPTLSESQALGPQFGEEVATLKASVEKLRRGVVGDLEAIRSLLPETASKAPLQDPATELDRLRSAVVGLLEQASGDDSIAKQRTLVREWIGLFGTTKDFEIPLLKRANILAATCLFAGERTIRETEFDWAIVDEAGRATAPELLVPLVRARRAILVGDERQLPPLLDDELSPERLKAAGIEAEDLEQSLFETLVLQARVSRPEILQMLSVQHRMHPAIGDLISHVFYGGALSHGVDASFRDHSLGWIERPVIWFSTARLPNKYEIKRGPTSRANPAEVDVIDRLLERMEASYREQGIGRDVGVISGYAGQVEQLSARIRPDDRSRWAVLDIEIATVDAFQGRDRDLVIYSAVRSNREGRVGFLRDRRRLNVALSRGRQLLAIVGDIATLESAAPGDRTNPFREVLAYMRAHPDSCQIAEWEW